MKTPIITTVNPAFASDPRKYKKAYYVIAFDKDIRLYNFFLECWDEAVKEGAVFTADMAWIKFRKKYVEGDAGWKKK